MPKQVKLQKTQKQQKAPAKKTIKKQAPAKQTKKAAKPAAGPKGITKEITTFKEQGDYFHKNESYTHL